MSFDRPWALALLVLPAILLWLRARAARPRAAEASSLLVWNKVSPVDTVPERPRPPIAAWSEAAGAALLAFGVAVPRGPEGAPAEPVLLLDDSPSMFARRPDGATRIESVRAAVAGLPTGATMTVDPEASLPALLAAGRPVVVATDHRLAGFADDPPGLRVVRFGKRGFNAGITAASGVPLPDGRWRVLVTVESWGATGPVEGTLSVNDVSSPITVQPGTPSEFLRDLDGGGPEFPRCILTFPGDSFPADDLVQLHLTGGCRVLVAPSSVNSVEATLRALLAAGAQDAGFPPSATGSRMFVAGVVDGAKVELNFSHGEEGEVVKGATVTTSNHVLLQGVVIDPSVTLGRRVAGETPGSTILSDGDGPLVTVEERAPTANSAKNPGPRNLALHFRFVPGGTWVERDPSFVVLAKNIVDYAAGGPARLEASGLLSPKETREAGEGETFGDLRAAIEDARRPDPASRVSYAALLLGAGGALLLAAWLGMR